MATRAFLPICRRPSRLLLRKFHPLRPRRPAGLCPAGPWPVAACEAMPTRSGSCPSPICAAIRERWRRSSGRSATTSLGTTTGGACGSYERWCLQLPNTGVRTRSSSARDPRATRCQIRTSGSENRKANATGPGTVGTRPPTRTACRIRPSSAGSRLRPYQDATGGAYLSQVDMPLETTPCSIPWIPRSPSQN
jgi:hypothetical protein